MNMIDGAFSAATANSARTNFSPSPKCLDIRDEAEIEKNVQPDSAAIARANKDLPVPGGPYNNTPTYRKHTTTQKKTTQKQQTNNIKHNKTNVISGLHTIWTPRPWAPCDPRPVLRCPWVCNCQVRVHVVHCVMGDG